MKCTYGVARSRVLRAQPRATIRCAVSWACALLVLVCAAAPVAGKPAAMSAESSLNAKTAAAAGLGALSPGRSCGVKTNMSEIAALEATNHLGDGSAPTPAAGEREAGVAAKKKYVSVYWHQITAAECSTTSCYGYLSTYQIKNQIAILNKAYNGGYAGYKVQTGFRFTLKGITRTAAPNYFYATVQSSADVGMRYYLRHRPGTRRVLNVFSVYGDTVNKADGWSSFSWWLRLSGSYGPVYDGVTISWLTVPGSFNNNAYGKAAQGKVLPHEVGHWLGLYHTFQGGCSVNYGDYVHDTVPEKRSASGCPTSRRTCHSKSLQRTYGKYYQDPYHNFMDYAAGRCVKSFTRGQSSRMSSAWYKYRA